ncbi:MAG: GNAT family N-acetyltransferase [Clostridia bacterium]|nr:GNAT family N-acetyltransferase [Clostridia bacterium]
MEYECREMNLNELEETMELVKKVFDEFEAPEYSDEGIKNFYKFANVENIKKLLKENLKIVIVKDYSKIIGMLAIRDNSHIGMLFVDKAYHRKGIAKYLIRYAKGLYGMNNTDITVNSSPYAVEIYKRMGFEILSNEKETDGIRFIPMVLKKYKLNNAKGELELVFPTEEYRDQIMDYLQEHFDNGEMILNGCGGLDRLRDFDSWLKKVRNDVDFAKCSEGRVPASLYMAIRKSDKRLIGLIQIRHCLNEKLLQTSGHIGDGVRPSERKKGYVTEMIRLALEKCKELGIKRVLMSCDKDNVGSRKSIMNNGGVLENEIKMEDESIEQRFWISLKKQSAHLNLKSLGNVEEKTIRVDEDDFKGYIHLNNFIKMNEKFLLPKGLCIRDTGYKWLEVYGENSNFKLTAIYDNLGRIVEWYFDLVRDIGRENGFPYDEDWYLDVVVTPDGDILLLDEDEYEEAYQRYEMTESEYKLGKDLVYDLMKRLENNVENLNNFTNKYLEKIESK